MICRQSGSPSSAATSESQLAERGNSGRVRALNSSSVVVTRRTLAPPVGRSHPFAPHSDRFRLFAWGVVPDQDGSPTVTRNQVSGAKRFNGGEGYYDNTCWFTTKRPLWPSPSGRTAGGQPSNHKWPIDRRKTDRSHTAFGFAEES